MTAIEQAAKMYAKAGLVLSRDLEQYLKFGFVIVTPERLLLWRPIVLAKGLDYWLADHGEADAWYVRMAVGSRSLRWFVEQMPYYLPKLAWQRGFKTGSGELHVFQTERIINYTGA